MAKRPRSPQRSPEGEPESLTSKLKLDKQAVSLDQRLVSGRTIPIEKVRDSAKVKVTSYHAEPDKYVAKVYRGNVLVAQEWVGKDEYSVEDVTQAYQQEILAGEYDQALTDVYQERKAGRGSS